MLSYVLSICTRRQCRAVRVTEELQGDYLRLGEAVREEHAPDLFHEHVWARERGDDARPPVTQRLAAGRSRGESGDSTARAPRANPTSCSSGASRSKSELAELKSE